MLYPNNSMCYATATIYVLARLVPMFGACAVGLGWQRSSRRMPSGYLADSDSQDLGNLRAGPSVDSTAATVATGRCGSAIVLHVGCSQALGSTAL